MRITPTEASVSAPGLRGRARLLSFACATCCSALPRPAAAQQAAQAQPEDNKALARRYFQRGVELGGQGAYAESLQEFSRAYELSPHYTVLYNIGQAQVALGHAADAVDALRRYLSEGGANIALERRQQVEAEIIRQFARTATLELRVDVAQALVTIDGTARGRTPLPGPLRLDAGVHQVQVALPSGERKEQSLTLVAEQHQILEFQLQAAKPAPLLPPPLSPPSQPSVPVAPGPLPRDDVSSSRGHGQTTLGIVLGAVGVGLGGAALAHYFWNRARYHEWQSQYSEYYAEPDATKRAEANQLAESIPRASAVTISLAIGAGLALGSGTFLVITDTAGGKATGSVVGWRGPW